LIFRVNDKKLLPRAKTESDKNYLQRKYATLDLKDVKNLEGELK